MRSEARNSPVQVVPDACTPIFRVLGASPRPVEYLAGFWFGACAMSLETNPRRKRIEDVRCPAVKGLPDDIYHILHHSFVEILKMRGSIESVDAPIDTSREAVIDSRDMLKRTRDAGL